MADTFDPIATSLVIAIVLLVGAVIAILVLASKTARVNRSALTSQNSINELQEEVHALQVNVETKAQVLYQSWVQRDCGSIRTSEREIALREASTQLEQWKYQSEMSIRSDAIQRSHSVILGKVTEHLVPFMPDFSFNPKDVRFVGSPIDLIVFDGMDEDNLRQVIFVEVKTGASAALTKRERRIRDIISGGKVKWMEMRVPREALLQTSINPAELPEHPAQTQPGEAQDEVLRIKGERDRIVAEFAAAVIQTIREKPAIGEFLFSRLANFRASGAMSQTLRTGATAAWRQGASEEALQKLKEFIASDPESVPFVKDVLVGDE